MMELAYPWVLMLLLVIPLLLVYELYWKKQPSVTVSTAEPFASVVARRRPSFRLIMMLLGLATLIIALARPRLGDEKIVMRSQGIDIVIIIDLSGSMDAYDIPPGINSVQALVTAIKKQEILKRVDLAKKEIARFIEMRPNDRIGLVGFAEQAYSFAPPTLDHAWLMSHLEQLRAGMIGQQTGIASSLATGAMRLKSSDAPRRVMVLFTDGENNIDNRLTPEQAGELCKEFNIVIHTVGIGGRNACVLVSDPFGGQRFQPFEDEFDEKLLRTLAETTGGTYFHASDNDGMRKVMDEINQLEKTTVEQPKYVEYREFGPKLALVALALLMLGFIADTTWGLRLP